MTRFFSDADIRAKVSMKLAIELMKEAFLQLSSRRVIVPVRTFIPTVDHSGCVLYMPSYSPHYRLFGLKMVSVFNRNTQRGLSAIQGNVLIMDGTNGSPLALLDAKYLTSLRTGAASGLATDMLARKNAEVLAIFGTGAQAETQLEGVLSVRPIKKVFIFGTSDEKATSFADKISAKHDLSIQPAKSFEDLKEADIICTATSSTIPVFPSQFLKAGAHINAVGAYQPTSREIPSDIIAKSLLVVDQYEAAFSEAGDVLLPMGEGIINRDHVHAELGELISGGKSSRTHDDQITVFKSVGNAIQDLAVANALLNK